MDSLTLPNSNLKSNKAWGRKTNPQKQHRMHPHCFKQLWDFSEMPWNKYKKTKKAKKGKKQASKRGRKSRNSTVGRGRYGPK